MQVKESSVRQLLWMVLNFHIHRYLMSNQCNRLDGAEKANEHIYISKVLCHFLNADGGIWTIRGISDEFPTGWREVHDWLAHNLTDRLDEVIGFPIFEVPTHEQSRVCARKFFDFIWEHLEDLQSAIDSCDDKLQTVQND